MIIPEEIKNVVFKCLDSKNHISYPMYSKNKTSEMEEFLKNNDITLTELKHIINDNLEELPRCIICNNAIHNYWSTKTGKYCSLKCAKKDPDIQEKAREKMKKTMREKYGVENALQNPNILEKVKKTIRERYGVENVLQNPDIREKIKKTNLEKYGYDYALQNPDILEKMKKTNLEKYGVEIVSQNPDILEKIKKTNLEKYGVENALQNPDIREKIKKTNLEKYGYGCCLQNPDILEKMKKTIREKYGVEIISQNTDVLEKMKKTNLEKYGVEIVSQNPDILEKMKKTNLEKYGVEIISQNPDIQEKVKKIIREKYGYESFMKYLNSKHLIMLSSKEDYIDSSEKELTFKCSICGQEFKTCNNTVGAVYCPNCKKYSYSIEEKELLETIKRWYSGEIIENDRKVIQPYELDIYIPEKNLAIEFNGDYWHSTSVDDDINKHQRKTLMCREKGIRLIHIFEYEWRTKSDICESIIKSALGIYDKTIFARKCVVKPISNMEYKMFLEKNHLEGSIDSSIMYGLFYQNELVDNLILELVSVIGFGKSNFNKNANVFELQRFCSKQNYKVIGGLSKLIKHSNIKDFFSYIDLAHFDCSGYFKCGFQEISITQPSYKWVNGYQILNESDFNLTESENMLQNNYYKIYDSGRLNVFKK